MKELLSILKNMPAIDVLSLSPDNEHIIFLPLDLITVSEAENVARALDSLGFKVAIVLLPSTEGLKVFEAGRKS